MCTHNTHVHMHGWPPVKMTCEVIEKEIKFFIKNAHEVKEDANIPSRPRKNTSIFKKGEVVP